MGRNLPWGSLVDSGFSKPRSSPGELRLIDCRYSLNSVDLALAGLLEWFGSGRLIGRWECVRVGRLDTPLAFQLRKP